MLVLDQGGRSVIWYREGGNKHIRQFSCPTEPLDAIFCSFPSISDDQEKMDVAVAILLARDHLCLHQTNGESFDISLDFEVDCMFATTDGLLLQSIGGYDRDGNKLFGNLFALPHPVTLVRPVTLMAAPASSFMNGESMSVDDIGMDDEDDDDNDNDGVYFSGIAQDKNESLGNLSLRTTSFSSPGGQGGGSSYRSDFDSNYESINRVVAVLDNIIITCQRPENPDEDTTINMWILQPLLTASDDNVDRAANTQAASRGDKADMLPPLAPSSGQESSLRSFRSISDGRGVHLGGRHGGSPTSWSNSTPERSDSPSFSSLVGASGSTEVLENALGVSTGVGVNSNRHYEYGAKGQPPTARNRSPMQHLLGRAGSGHHGMGSVDFVNDHHVHSSGGGAGATPAGHSLLSGLSANTADEESFAVINALSNAELSLALVDSASLAVGESVSCDELQVQFTGHSHTAGGLVLHVLHPSTGFHCCFSITLRLDAGAQGQRKFVGSIVALPVVEFSRPPVSLASCRVPLYPSAFAECAPGLSVPITLILLADREEEGQDLQGGKREQEGVLVALLVGGTCIGETKLRWDDDLDIDAILSADTGAAASAFPNSWSGSGANGRVVGLTTCASPMNGFVVRSASGAFDVVSFEPALFNDEGGRDKATSSELVLSVLAVLQSIAGATDPITQPEKKRQYTSLAESVLGLLVQSTAILGAEGGMPLLVSALFGNPLDSVPEIADVVSRGGPRSPETEVHLAFLYSRVVQLVQALSGEGINLRATVFDSLHAVVEDGILSQSHATDRGVGMRGVLQALARCAVGAGGAAGELYGKYYARLLGHVPDMDTDTVAGETKEQVTFTKFPLVVPSAVQWVAQCLQVIEEAGLSTLSGGSSTPGAGGVRSLPLFFLPPRLRGTQGLAPCPTLRTTKRFLKALLSRVTTAGMPFPAAKARLVADSFVTSSSRECLRNLALLPPLLRVTVELAFHASRESPSVQWPDDVLRWIGREDLCHFHHRQQGSAVAAADAGLSPSTQYAGTNAAVVKGQEAFSDGLDEVEAAASLRFAEDDRVHEACRMLRSSSCIYLRLEKAPETSDLDHRHQLQLRLLSLCRRSLACSVGRGMLTLGSLEPLIAEALPVPPLNLAGRVPPNNTIVHLDTASAPAELTLWPDFHNGAAAGLRVGLGVGKQGDKYGAGAATGAGAGGASSYQGVRITRYWIIYNRTAAAAAAAAALAAKNSNAATAGSNNVSTESAISSHAGVLLALGLQGHLSVLGKGDICEYLTQGHEPTTIAMLIGIAASKLGSADPHMSKTLCLYLPTLLPPRHWDINISPLVQTAALAGLGLLHAGSGHRLITEFLLAELSRRPPSDRCDNRETMALAASWALGLVLLGKGGSGSSGRAGSVDGMEGLLDLRIDDRLCQLFTGGRKPEESLLFPSAISPTADGGSRASRSLEGDDINTDLTGPGALIALALIYIKSNNAEVARRMAVPETTHSLDSVRPDMLLYRALGVCLVMWDDVEPSEEWIDAQVPAVIDKALFPARHAPPPSVSGSAEEKGPSVLPDEKGRQLAAKDALYLYMCVITGYCFGIGLVYAGTSDINAKNAILGKLKFLQKIRDNRLNLGLSPSLILERSVKPLVDMCVGVVAISLSVVMAGTGDVESLRVVRELRWKVEEVNFGTHMALSMSIGMLFLAGGNASVKRDPLSIACLLLSICPRFPSRTVDNQYHLQAFRHLYVVAVESRVLKSVDVDTGESVPVTVDMEMKDGRHVPIRAPCLLPELDSIASLRINSGGGSQTDGYAEEVKRESGGMDIDTTDSSMLSATSSKQRQLDIFCGGGAGGSPQHSAAQDLYPLELRFGADPDVGSGPGIKSPGSDGQQALSTSSVTVTVAEAQNLRVKRRAYGAAGAGMTPFSRVGEAASRRLEKVQSEFLRARLPSQTPSLPERAEIDGEILRETYLQMLREEGGIAAMRGAVERTTLLNFL